MNISFTAIVVVMVVTITYVVLPMFVTLPKKVDNFIMALLFICGVISLLSLLVL